eukprot:10830099-Lingulodinium_polyedra.AAC.1
MPVPKSPDRKAIGRRGITRGPQSDRRPDCITGATRKRPRLRAVGDVSGEAQLDYALSSGTV